VDWNVLIRGCEENGLIGMRCWCLRFAQGAKPNLIFVQIVRHCLAAHNLSSGDNGDNGFCGW